MKILCVEGLPVSLHPSQEALVPSAYLNNLKHYIGIEKNDIAIEKNVFNN